MNDGDEINSASQAETPGWFTSGGMPCVFTVGEIIQNIVDGSRGSDIAICAVESIGPSNENGEYKLILRLELVPVSLLAECLSGRKNVQITQKAVTYLKIKGVGVDDTSKKD